MKLEDLKALIEEARDLKNRQQTAYLMRSYDSVNAENVRLRARLDQLEKMNRRLRDRLEALHLSAKV